MATAYMTPGVYIEEQNAFPNSEVAVETAVPVFIGYTEKAELNHNSLVNKPTKIVSFAEYLERFGGAFRPKFTVTQATTPDLQQKAQDMPGNAISVPNADPTKPDDVWYIDIAQDNTLYLFNSIRLFYANGGGPCYILSVGTYKGKATMPVSPADFIGSADKPVTPFDLLKKEQAPTMVLVPDAIALGKDAYNQIYTKVLEHCSEMQSRFGIFDLARQLPTEQTDDVVTEFRTDIGVNSLNYGAAYYPWLNSAIVQADEVDLDNLDFGSASLETILTEPAAKTVIDKYTKDSADPTITQKDKLKDSYLQALKAVSPTYVAILGKVRIRMNELPPSGAMAGIYSMVDNSRGVWKAPANVSVSSVVSPSVNISSEGQQNLNVDVIAGKSINVIRSFPGIGTMVWGARTLDGNSQDWRYINVRRTLIMIEQSIKLATQAYVFEPNDANTWITVKSMIDNFLVNLWKQGALAGAAPEQAFSVAVGLGSTMTANDILDGKMLITVKVAIVRPAEFIVITFQQQMQQS
ncbi:MAG: phage tail sheath family protein [Bacteroidetes bacterium]|nr:phage tail sheath family protein [Bacteroidota bacterium]